jgi:hypothetical protein
MLTVVTYSLMLVLNGGQMTWYGTTTEPGCGDFPGRAIETWVERVVAETNPHMIQKWEGIDSYMTSRGVEYRLRGQTLELICRREGSP